MLSPASVAEQQAAVRISALCKRYDEVEALSGISFEVRRGELFGFLGPNGAGKTTTLTILAGLLEATSGSAQIAGYDVRTHPIEAKQRLGYVPDRPYVYEKLTGMELMELFGDLYGVPRAQTRERAVYWLEVFGMVGKADQLIESYSHGMRQRIILCATLLTDPEVLVLDEPMVGLDPQGARLLKDLLRQRCRAGKTVIISTHTLQVAEETCDRVCIIHRGRVAGTGTVAELREQLAPHGASLEEIFLAITGGG